MALQQDVTAADDMFLGDDLRLELQVFNDTGLTDEELLALKEAGTATPVDVSGWDLLWALRKKDGSADPTLIEKSSGDGISIIGLFDASQSLNTQKVRIDIADTDTYNTGSPVVALRKGTYRHALKRMDDGSEKVLVFGKFVFLQATTR